MGLQQPKSQSVQYNERVETIPLKPKKNTKNQESENLTRKSLEDKKKH